MRTTTHPSDVAGGVQAFLAMTPVRPGEQEPLTAFLRGLSAGGDSPFARVPGTHVGRLVVVHDFHHDPAYGQRHEDHLDLPYLVLSACVDGDADRWLAGLCRALAPEAPQVWGRCVGGPADGDPDALLAYLQHNRLRTGVFYAAYDATVAQVRDALRRREQVIAVAQRTQGLPPEALHSAVLTELGARP